MSRRERALACASAALLSIGLGLVAHARAGIDGVPEALAPAAEIFARERASGVTTISAHMIEQIPTRRNFDELIAQLPADRKITPGYLPGGWRVEQRGKRVRAWGPPVDDVHVRFDLGGNYTSDYAGKSATLQGGLSGRLDNPIKLTIGTLPPANPTPNLEGILTLPPQAAPGQPLLVGVAPSYRDGLWQLASETGPVPLIPLETLRDIDVNSSKVPEALYGLRQSGALVRLLSRQPPRPYVTAFPEKGRFTGVTFTDGFGERLVDAPVNVLPVPPAPGTPWIGGGTDLAFAGQAACVSGRFPRLDDAYGLRLDGNIDLQPWGASPTTVMLGIPDGTAAGPHTISVADGSSSVTIGIMTVEGSIDQNKLWRGESTTMRLRVIGTDRQFPLTVLNRTPGVISVDGGVYQTITTPGGVDNVVTRSVRGIHRGNFTIVYSVNLAGCGAPSGGL
jgi:hypothetical protein